MPESFRRYGNEISSMNHPLAVFAPVVGARSETFIRRHVQDLLPGKTVVVTGEFNGYYGNHWTAEGPLLALNQIPEPHFRHRVVNAVALRAGWKRNEDDRRANARDFLQKHGARVAMGEFLSWSLQWLDVAHKLGIPFFGHAHGFDVSAHLRLAKWRDGYRRYNDAGGIITVSEHSKAKLLALGLNADKVHVVPCGVDVPPEPLVRPEQDTISCLAVGRMTSKKGPILVLDAFRRALQGCARLHLDYVGEGELLPAAQQFIRAFNLEGRVTLHGSHPSEVVRGFMERADIFVQHSMTDPETGDEEGLPVAILEAMANSLPVVSTRHAGIPEAVLEGSTGFLVDEGDSRAMADCLITLARDADLRRRMGHAGWRVALERFTWSKERVDLCTVLGLEARSVPPQVH